MHLSDEQRKEQLKQEVASVVRDLISRRAELKEQGACARKVWDALLNAPEWQVAMIQQPDAWVEPEEIWSITPEIKKP